MNMLVLQPGEAKQLTSLPAEWNRKRLRYLSSRPIRNGLGEAANSDDPDNPRYIRITDIAGPRHLRQDTFRSLPPEVARDAKVHEHDILISAVGATYGKSYYAQQLSGESCFAGYLVRLSPAVDIEPSFLAYWTESRDYWSQVDANVIQSTIQNFSAAKVRHLNAPVPPLETQRCIAKFLDEKTAQIDGLIEKKGALLDRLAEKRQALITRAVTKGIDPVAPMKPSNIEWLGHIPAHWEVLPLKRLVVAGIGLQMGPFGGMLTNLPDYETGFKLYGQENTISGDFRRGRRWVEEERFHELERYQLVPGDLVITRKGSLGSCRRVPSGIQPGIADSDTIRIRPNHSRLLAEWALTLLHEAHFVSEQISAERRGAILSGLNTTVVGGLLFTAPPVDEQNNILSALDRILSRDDTIVAKVTETINRLVEYRAALITAAVTGKLAEFQ